MCFGKTVISQPQGTRFESGSIHQSIGDEEPAPFTAITPETFWVKSDQIEDSAPTDSVQTYSASQMQGRVTSRGGP